MWTQLRFWAGKFLNTAGVPGVILSGTYEAGIGQGSVRVTVGPLFTVVTVNGLDVYFHRFTGVIDGVGFSVAAGCPADGTPVPAQAIGSDGGPDLGVVLKFPAGTSLAGGSYLLVLANQLSTGGPYLSCDGLAPTCYWVDWGISKDGEGVYLLAPNRSILDQVYYPAGITGGHTFGREPNGTGRFVVTAATPNGPNAL